MQAFFSSQPYISRMAEKTDPLRGKHLRALREATGLSQRELARQLDVHHSNIGFWETTGIIPRSGVLSPMAKILGVTVEQLLGEKNRAKHLIVPSGRARLAFDAISKLPKRQQQKIVEVVEAFVEHQSNGHKQAA